ncbi:putative membrane protein [Corynebacterium variabile DSM 44702]|uniref:Putative membrane protein n=2 Tax=Corynebacterium variabile TaxID=1727 RepID=G0HAJ8_CORVD|nr:putative membrane protein [Corynebacterium variabile DSM 44702]
MPIPAPFTRSQSGAAGITFRTDRERPRILSGYVLVLSVFAGLVNALYWSGRQQPDDWSSLWIAGILVNNGNSDHIYDFDPTDFAAWSGSAWQEVIVTNDLSAAPHPFVHIPGVAYAVAPFTDVLSFEASVVWLTALCGACLPLLVSASWALWSRTTVPLPALLAITVAAWYATAFQSGMWLGQTTPIILCMTVCGIAYARDRPVAAGIVLGLAGIVKLTPLGLIPLMLLFRHYRRGAATATATAAFVALASLVVGGGGLFGTWIDRMRWLSAHVVVTGSNRSGPNPGWWTRGFDSGYESEFTRAPCLVGLW